MSDTEVKKPEHRVPVLQGILPVTKSKIPVDIIAGVTLATLAIPEVMGYTSIAGMPVITGLYTILIPLLAVRAARLVAPPRRRRRLRDRRDAWPLDWPAWPRRSRPSTSRSPAWSR